MTEPSAPLRRTPLYETHQRHEAKLVPFGGWEMPIQYPEGILAEHLQTRRSGGLFDVSHMGRFWIEGPAALDFLQYALTHNVRKVAVGRAQYNLMATPEGGTVDDCYVYRLAERRYLLVVNAANIAKDFRHLETIRAERFPAATLRDETDGIAMLALQGPAVEGVLQEAVSRLGAVGTLPRRGRNNLCALRMPDGSEFLVTRTGYTGEPVCFELFVAAAHARALWDALLMARPGAVKPVGLGARNTLRAEAGLPLYGDELSERISGIVAGLHRLAIRLVDKTADFCGKQALLRQYLEGPRERVVPFVMEGRGKAARDGDGVAIGGRRVGRVTSATTVPYDVEGKTEPGLRRVGFALVPPTCRVGFSRGEDRRYGETIRIVRDKDGQETTIGDAELVEGFARLSADRKRLVPVLYPPPETSGDAVARGGALARDLVRGAARNDRWRQRECVNLIASENTPSAFVRRMQALDPAGRYAEHRWGGFEEVYYYQGTDWIRWVEEELQRVMRRVFGCRNVEARPVSGQMANETVFEAMVRFGTFKARRTSHTPARMPRVFAHGLALGGHLSSQPMGALYGWVDVAADGTPAVTRWPVRRDYPYAIDVPAVEPLLRKHKPVLAILGKSMVLEPEPVREIARMLDSLPLEERPILMVDMAHVLGLYGPSFQKPLQEGADIVTGSTHKTFPGPQRGIILSDLDETFGRRKFLWEAIHDAAFPGATSNHHLGTLQGLLAAAIEFEAFGRAYQEATLANAKAFARALADAGLTVEGDASRGYTQTHQVLVRIGPGKGIEAARRLEGSGIICNFQGLPGDRSFTVASGLRMGVQEMTRFGMDAAAFGELAGLVADCLARGKTVGDAVSRLRGRFLTMRYCFDDGILTELPPGP